MGEKQAGKREHFFFFIAGYLIIVLTFSGCVGKDKGYLAKKRIESAFETEGQRSLASARSFMARELFKESMWISESVLKQYPLSLGDQALLNIGLIYTHPANPEADAKKSIKYFKRLVKAYPESTLKVEAEIWIAVLQDQILQNRKIRKLTDRLDVLKQNDKAKADQFNTIQRKLIKSQNHVKELKSQIDQLKHVDLRIEEKRRKNGSR